MTAAVPRVRPAEAHLTAILLTLATVFLFASMNGFSKTLTEDYSVLQTVWARYTFSLVFVFVIMFGRGQRLRTMVRTQQPVLQVTRAALLVASTFLFIWALSMMPLADVEAITFVGPLFVTALSVPLLKEQVGWRRWVAVSIGFIGVLVIIRPGMGVMSAYAILPVLVALCYALYQVVTRFLARTDDSLTTLFYSSVLGTVGISCIVPFVWKSPDLWGWLYMIACGGLGGLSHFLLIKALERAPASMLQPITYTQLLWATLIGYVVFGTFPDTWTIVGAGVVVASGLYVVYRERMQNARRGSR